MLRTLYIAGMPGGFGVHEEYIGVADDPVIRSAVGIRITEGRFFAFIIEIFFWVVIMGESGGILGEDTTIAHGVTFPEDGGLQSGVFEAFGEDALRLCKGEIALSAKGSEVRVVRL